MNKDKILLVGAGGHAISCMEIIESDDLYEIVGLIGYKGERNKKVLNYNIIGCDDNLSNLLSKSKNAFITIGQIKSSSLRKKMFTKLIKIGYKLPTIISSTSLVSRHSYVSKGSIVMKNAIINAGVTIGKNCIINNGAIIEHGVEIGDHCHISTGVIINGDVKIGHGTFIGSQSTVKEGVKIGMNSVVGMGSRILKNIDNNLTHID